MSLNLKDYNYWNTFIGQIKFNVFSHAGHGIMNTFVWQIGDEVPSSSRNLCRSCRETEELKRRCLQEANTEKRRTFEECSTQHDRESRTVSLLRDQIRKLQERLEHFEDSKILTHRAGMTATYVFHQDLITSSSRKPSREVGMPRNSREDMSIPGNVFDRQHARRDPDELLNDSRNLATSSAILRTEGIENNGSDEPLQLLPLPCFFVRAKKKSGRQMSLMSMTNHAVGIGTCSQSMTLPSYLSSEMHLEKFFLQTEFQSWVVNFRAEVCAKAKNLALALQWIKEIEAASSLKDLVNPTLITGKGFSDYEELDFMMAAELKRCYDQYPHFQRGSASKSRKPKRTTDFLEEVRLLFVIYEFTRRDTCSFLHTHATGDRVRQRGKKMEDARKFRLEQASSSAPKQTDVNGFFQSKGQSCD